MGGGGRPPILRPGAPGELPRIEFDRPIVEPLEVVPDPFPSTDLSSPGLSGMNDLIRLGNENPPAIPGVLNPPDTSALAPPPVPPPSRGLLGGLWDGITNLFGSSRPVSEGNEGERLFCADDDTTPDPAAARRAIALVDPLPAIVTPADDAIIRQRTELDGRFGEFNRSVAMYRVFQFPHAQTLESAAQRLDALQRDYHNSLNPTFSPVSPASRDWAAELRGIEAEVNIFLGQEAKREVAASSEALRQLAHASGDAVLEARVGAFEARIGGAAPGAFDAETALSDFRRLLSDVLVARARFEAQSLGMPGLTDALERGFDNVAQNLANLHVAGNGLSAAALDNFVYSAVSWAHDFPPPAGTGTIDFLQPFLTHHFVPGTRPSADAMLATVTNNLEGYRQVFGDRAGAMFYRQERLVSEIRGADGQPTGFYMTVERGSHEYDSGIRVAIWEGDPATQHEHAPVARLGLNFGADRSIQIVNLQGPSRELRDMDWTLAPRPGAYDRLQAALGGGRPFNMMLGLVLHWAHGAGFQRAYGIRDEAQGARASGLDAAAQQGTDVSDRGNMYRMIFGTFGFKSRADNPDYVVLDLTRGSHDDYMAKILRKGAPRAEDGTTSEGPERSFWGMLAPSWNLLQPVATGVPFAVAAPTGSNPLRIPPSR